MEDLVLHPIYIAGLSVLAAISLVFMWWCFWKAAASKDNNVLTTIQNSAFLKTVTVIGVIAATVILTLVDKLGGDIAGAILSGVAGYVLGNTSNN